MIAQDLLSFLDQNKNYDQIMLHGFSVGGYMWGEVLELIQQDRKKYDHVIERIVGQVWDSAADISELTIGTPRAVFPKNEVMQKLLAKYLEYVSLLLNRKVNQTIFLSENVWVKSDTLRFHYSWALET